LFGLGYLKMGSASANFFILFLKQFFLQILVASAISELKMNFISMIISDLIYFVNNRMKTFDYTTPIGCQLLIILKSQIVYRKRIG